MSAAHRCRRRAAAALLLCCLCVTANTGLALPDDRNQPIEILADQALRDDQKGYTVYTGEVELTQGSLRIEADRLTVFHAEGDGQRIVAEGSPARMQQQPDTDKAMLYARASVITYFRAAERVQLRENASVEQDGAVVRGDLIVYLIPEQRVRADASADNADSRVQVVIPARVADDETEQEGSSAATDAAADNAVKQTPPPGKLKQSQPPEEDPRAGAEEAQI